MKSTLCAACVLLALPADHELRTVYRAESALRIESTLELEWETTAMSMVRDGEPVEGRGFGGGGTSSTTRSVVVDRYLEVAGAAPARVQRRWEELEGESSMSFGGEDRSLTLESDFEDLLVELARDEDGELAVEVLEGTGPDVEVLERLRPGLALDAFLTGDAVAEGAEWTLDSDAIRHGLGLDVSYFRAPQREGGGPGGGRGGGRRGGFGGGADAQLAGVEWSGRARFAALEVFEGLECARIALELEGESEREDESSSSTTTAELEGTLWVALESRRPVGLDLEGAIASEMDSTRERDGSVMEMHRESEGTYKQRVRVGDAPFAEDE